MNWSKAKTILILFFLMVDSFLLYQIVVTNQDKNYVSDEVIKNTVTILEKNQINVAPELIPNKKGSVRLFESDNIISDYESFSKLFLGNDLTKVSDTAYSGVGGKVEFWGDKFRFTSSSLLFVGKPKKNDILSFFQDKGIKLTGCEFYEEDNVQYLKKTENKLEVFNSFIKVENTDKTVISGLWFERKTDGFTSSTGLNPSTSALIDFLSSQDKPNAEITILNIEKGYNIYEPETFHKSIMPAPVWEIEHTMGSAYIDARKN